MKHLDIVGNFRTRKISLKTVKIAFNDLDRSQPMNHLYTTF